MLSSNEAIFKKVRAITIIPRYGTNVAEFYPKDRDKAEKLTAMDQCFVHSKMYEDWGLTKLHERLAHEFEDEKGHAAALIEQTPGDPIPRGRGFSTTTLF